MYNCRFNLLKHEGLQQRVVGHGKLCFSYISEPDGKTKKVNGIAVDGLVLVGDREHGTRYYTTAPVSEVTLESAKRVDFITITGTRYTLSVNNSWPAAQ